MTLLLNMNLFQEVEPEILRLTGGVTLTNRSLPVSMLTNRLIVRVLTLAGAALYMSVFEVTFFLAASRFSLRFRRLSSTLS